MLKKFVAGALLAGLYVAACAILLLPGCASLEAAAAANPERVSTFAGIATVAYIDQAPAAERAELAARVIEVVRVVELAAADESVGLEELVRIAREALPADMTPPRQALALELIGFLQGELQRRVEVGSLVNVRQVLTRVRVYASLYLPAG